MEPLAFGDLVEDQLELVVVECILQNVVAFGEGELAGRGEDRIYRESEDVLDQVGNQPLQNSAAELETRVGVDLDQPYLEVFVNHEIQAK